MVAPTNGDEDVDVITLPTGGKAARCKARTRSGARCGMPARRGFAVCFKHGAGTRVRRDSGTARPPGRPRVHGLYSDAGRASIREEVRRLEEANIDLDNTDREMLVARAVNVYLLSEIDRVQDAREGRLKSMGQRANADRPVRFDGEDRALQIRLDALMHRLAINSVRIIKMVQRRAEIKTILSRDHSLESLRKYAVAVRNIVWDLLDDEQLDIFEDRLRKEVFGPEGIEFDAAGKPLPENSSRGTPSSRTDAAQRAAPRIEDGRGS